MGYEIKISYHSNAYKYLKKLNQNEQNKIMLFIEERINRFIKYNDRSCFHRDAYFSKLGIFDSTVYYLKISFNERAIISIDEDPIFEQVIVNVFTICKRDKIDIAIRSVMESLYQKMVNLESYDEEGEEPWQK